MGRNAGRRVCENGPMYGVDDISAVHIFLHYGYYSAELVEDEAADEEYDAHA